MVLGLGGNLLPVVPDSNATRSPGSQVAAFGKIPSAYNKEGQAFGLKDWQKRPILPNEAALWLKDSRLGMCVRTGSISGLYAIDVDSTDPKIAAQTQALIFSVLGPANVRGRPNSLKFLVPVWIDGLPELEKRIIKLPNKERIEFLADGQQFVAAGSHPSGARYMWYPEAQPRDFAHVSLAAFNALWDRLKDFGEPEAPKATGWATGTVNPGDTITIADEAVLTTISEEDLQRLNEALRWPKLIEQCADNESWSEVGYALLSIGETGRQLFSSWSAVVPNYEAGAPEAWWHAHSGQSPRSDYRHIFNLARGSGWGRAASTLAFGLVAPGPDVRDPALRSDGGEGSNILDVENIPVPERPDFRFTNTDKAGQVKAACLRLAATHSAYVSGSSLVRISRTKDLAPDDPMRAVERDDEQQVILEMSPEYFITRFGEIVRPLHPKKQKGGGVEWIEGSCEKKFADLVMGQGDWPNLNRLIAMSRSPFVRYDGSICDTPGYDRRSAVYYAPPPNVIYPKLPEKVTYDDARAALAILREPFSEFPYAAEVRGSESAFLAHILTEAARTAMDHAPVFWYSAPYRGTGKTLLCDMPSHIVHGGKAAHRPWPASAEELRKTLFASLLAGDRSIQFDNLPNGYKARSPDLCAFITSSTWQDRKLGASQAIRVENCAVVSASGNNITPVSDLSRRSIVIRLDANSTQTTSRTFKIKDLKQYVLDHRTELLTAALTIIKGWQQNKTDDMPNPLASFEQWSDLVRNALLWLGMDDPVDTQREETDDEEGATDAAFSLLGLHFAGQEFMAPQICALVTGFSDTTGVIGQALMNAGCGDAGSPVKVGYWLRDHRDNIGGGYKLVKVKKTKVGQVWAFKPVGEMVAATGNEDLI